MKRYVIFLIVLAFLLAGCSNHDPNMNNSDGTDKISGEFTDEIQDIPEYINKDELANRSYELHYLLGQEKFSSPDEMSPNAIVQFAFCHIYYDNLCEMPTTGMRLRTAAEYDINTQILRYFGKVTTDIKRSDLYNKSTGKFEMWEPKYGSELFYDAKLVKNDEGFYVCTTVFFSDSDKQEPSFTTVLTVEDNGDRAIIRQLASR